MWWSWDGTYYKNMKSIEKSLEDAEWVKPVLVGNRVKILVKHPTDEEPKTLVDSEASVALEFVLKRLISGNPNDAMGTIFKRVGEAQDISKSNGNGHKTRKPKVYRDRDKSIKIMKLSARGRWAEQRGEVELAQQYRREAEELKASRSTESSVAVRDGV